MDSKSQTTFSEDEIIFSDKFDIDELLELCKDIEKTIKHYKDIVPSYNLTLEEINESIKKEEKECSKYSNWDEMPEE